MSFEEREKDVGDDVKHQQTSCPKAGTFSTFRRLKDNALIVTHNIQRKGAAAVESTINYCEDRIKNIADPILRIYGFVETGMKPNEVEKLREDLAPKFELKACVLEKQTTDGLLAEQDDGTKATAFGGILFVYSVTTKDIKPDFVVDVGGRFIKASWIAKAKKETVVIVYNQHGPSKVASRYLYQLGGEAHLARLEDHIDESLIAIGGDWNKTLDDRRDRIPARSKHARNEVTAYVKKHHLYDPIREEADATETERPMSWHSKPVMAKIRQDGNDKKQRDFQALLDYFLVPQGRRGQIGRSGIISREECMKEDGDLEAMQHISDHCPAFLWWRTKSQRPIKSWTRKEWQEWRAKERMANEVVEVTKSPNTIDECKAVAQELDSLAQQDQVIRTLLPLQDQNLENTKDWDAWIQERTKDRNISEVAEALATLEAQARLTTLGTRKKGTGNRAFRNDNVIWRATRAKARVRRAHAALQQLHDQKAQWEEAQARSAKKIWNVVEASRQVLIALKDREKKQVEKQQEANSINEPLERSQTKSWEETIEMLERDIRGTRILIRGYDERFFVKMSKTLRSLMHELEKLINNTISWLAQSSRERFIEELTELECNNPAGFFKRLNLKDRRKDDIGGNLLIGKNGAQLSDPEDIREDMTEFWKDILTSKTSQPRKEELDEKDWFKSNEAKKKISIRGFDATIGWKHNCIQDLDSLLQNANNYKTPGTDGMLTSSLKYSQGPAKMAFLFLHNWRMRSGELPTVWREGRIIMIPKKPGPKAAGSFRPITLLNIGLKLSNALIGMDLGAGLTDAEIIADQQAGFMAGRTVFQNIQALISAMDNAMAAKAEQFIVFYDLAKAFDSIEFWAFQDILERHGVPNYMLKAIMSSYQEKSVHLSLGKWGESDKFNVSVGVAQGDPLSTTLFIMTINPLIKWINRKKRDKNNGNLIQSQGYRWRRKQARPGEHKPKFSESRLKTGMLAFADDMAFVANSEAELQRVHKQILEFLDTYGLRVNAAKCGVIKTGSTVKKGSGLKVNGEEIPRVHKSYRYLGYHIHPQLIWKEHHERTAEKANNKVERIKRLPIHYKSAIRIINTILFPTILFATKLASPPKSMIKSLQAKANSIVRKKMGASTNTTNDMLRFLGLFDLEFEVYTSQVSVIKDLILEKDASTGALETRMDIANAIGPFGERAPYVMDRKTLETLTDATKATREKLRKRYKSHLVMRLWDALDGIGRKMGGGVAKLTWETGAQVADLRNICPKEFLDELGLKKKNLDVIAPNAEFQCLEYKLFTPLGDSALKNHELTFSAKKAANLTGVWSTPKKKQDQILQLREHLTGHPQNRSDWNGDIPLKQDISKWIDVSDLQIARSTWGRVNEQPVLRRTIPFRITKSQEKQETTLAFVDGSLREGKAGYGVCVWDAEGKHATARGRAYGKQEILAAEFQALEFLLMHLPVRKGTNLAIIIDNKTVCDTVKEANLPPPDPKDRREQIKKRMRQRIKETRRKLTKRRHALIINRVVELMMRRTQQGSERLIFLHTYSHVASKLASNRAPSWKNSLREHQRLVATKISELTGLANNNAKNIIKSGNAAADLEATRGVGEAKGKPPPHVWRKWGLLTLTFTPQHLVESRQQNPELIINDIVENPITKELRQIQKGTAKNRVIERAGNIERTPPRLKDARQDALRWKMVGRDLPTREKISKKFGKISDKERQWKVRLDEDKARKAFWSGLGKKEKKKAMAEYRQEKRGEKRQQAEDLLRKKKARGEDLKKDLEKRGLKRTEDVDADWLEVKVDELIVKERRQLIAVKKTIEKRDELREKYGDNKCPHCGEEETIHHIFNECSGYEEQRKSTTEFLSKILEDVEVAKEFLKTDASNRAWEGIFSPAQEKKLAERAQHQKINSKKLTRLVSAGVGRGARAIWIARCQKNEKAWEEKKKKEKKFQKKRRENNNKESTTQLHLTRKPG